MRESEDGILRDPKITQAIDGAGRTASSDASEQPRHAPPPTTGPPARKTASGKEASKRDGRAKRPKRRLKKLGLDQKTIDTINRLCQSVCRRLGLPLTEAEDLAQETLLALAESSFDRRRADRGSYVWQVAYRHAIAMRRSSGSYRRRAFNIEMIPTPEQTPPPQINLPTDQPESAPGDSHERDLLREWIIRRNAGHFPARDAVDDQIAGIERAWAMSSSKARAIIRLFYFEGKSHGEIAKSLSITKANSYKIASRFYELAQELAG